MKKLFLLTVFISTLCIIGCEKDSYSGSYSTNSSNSSNDTNQTFNDSIVPPTVNWYQIVKLNGFTTFLAELQNNCSHVIDGDFTALFYDDSNKFLYSVPELTYMVLVPGQKQLVWYNASPLTTDAKKVKIQFTSTGGCYYTPVALNKTKEEVVAGGVTIGFVGQSNVSEADVQVVFFYDEEVVGLSWHSFFSNSDEFTYKCSRNFNSYKIYYKAFA